jgi:membrane protease YdiL (CAAX protease family)
MLGTLLIWIWFLIIIVKPASEYTHLGIAAMESSFWQAIDRFATDQPIIFSGAIASLLLLLLLFAILVGIAASKTAARRQIGESIGRLLGVAVLMLITQRLGWLELAGFKSPGTAQSWGFMMLALIYVVIAYPYTLTRSLSFRPEDPGLAASLALNATSAALIEEIAFRGMILYALIRAWEGSQPGVLGAVFVSSVFFSLIHVLNLLAGETIGRVAPQVAWSLLGGIFFASLVVFGMSIWPAVLLHASANVAIRLNLQTKPGFQPSTKAYVGLAGLSVPLAILGIAIL